MTTQRHPHDSGPTRNERSYWQRTMRDWRDRSFPDAAHADADPPAPAALGPWDSHDLRIGPEPELLLITRRPTPAMVREFKEAPAEFRLALGDRILVLTFRFGNLPWAMQPWGLWEAPVDEADYQLPGARNESMPVRLLLSHPRKGLIAERTSIWPAGFADCIRIVVAGTLAVGARPSSAYADLVRMLSECQTPAAMAASTTRALAEALHEFIYVDRP